ncbi:MAG: addiction module toxin RelE, partial [Acidobacteria bacterium]
MARALRIQAAGLTYHVWARGSGRMAIYLDEQDRLQFLELLGQALVSHNAVCHGFCEMTNHYHLVITTNEPNLSHTIHEVNFRYAQWWNRQHSRPGHVLQGRFGAQIVQDKSYLLSVCRYVVLNPVRAGLVRSPNEWKWSSYRATAGLEDVPPFLSPQTLWDRLGGKKAEAKWRRYREFVCTGGDGVPAPPCEPVLGDEMFVQRFKDHRAAARREVPARFRRARPPLTNLLARVFTAGDR